MGQASELGRAAQAQRWTGSMTIDANAIFEEELLQRGTSYVREDEQTYRIQLEGREISANLANMRRNAERDQDSAAIGHFVDKLIETFSSTRPPWSEASALLFWAAEPADQEFGDFIYVVEDDSPLLGHIGSVVVN